MNILKSAIIACALLFFAPSSFANDSSSGTGTVVETLDSGGYTYIRLQENNRWVASKTLSVLVGDQVQYAGAAEMGEFHSRTLDRTFENILFTQNLAVIPPIEGEAHSNSAMADQLGIAKSTAIATPEAGEITLLDGAKSIDAIRSEYQQLKG